MLLTARWLSSPLPHQYPTPYAFSMGVSLEREKFVLRVEYRIDPFVDPTPAHTKPSCYVSYGLTATVPCHEGSVTNRLKVHS